MDAPVVVVPLYIYPSAGAWAPLLEVAKSNPHIAFIAVVNPSSGPGDGELPDVYYMAGLQELDGVANIQCLGYVYASYGQRNLGSVIQDIDRYRGWNRHFELNGIFFDEVPSNLDLLDHMATLATHTKASWAADWPGRPATVVFNPGVVIPQPFYDHADLVVAFEQSEEYWNSYFVLQGLLQIAPDLRAKSAAIIHSCENTTARVEGLVAEVQAAGLGGFYTTDQVGGGYSQWPAHLATQILALSPKMP